MRRIKVLQVLEASVGGARKHVVQILRGLDRERFELHLACSVEREPAVEALLDDLREEGIGVTELRMVRRLSPLADWAACRRLRALIRDGQYDIVHTHAAKAGFLGRRAARRAGVPVVLHTPHCFPFQLVDSSLVPFYRFLERRAARWANRIVLVAESQREVALGARLCSGERLAVVENGVRLPEEDTAALRRRYREELGIAEDALAVGFVGRVTPQKDVQTFLSMVDGLLPSLPDLTVCLVGGASNLPYLRSLRPPVAEDARRVLTSGGPTNERVFWSPAMPVRVLGQRPDADRLVAAFDVVVLPSRYEGLPYSLLEAMACRVPVVASDVTGNHDAIEDGISGFLAPPQRTSAFAQLTARLLASDELRREMGAAARERVAARFTEERFLGGIASLYESLAT